MAILRNVGLVLAPLLIYYVLETRKPIPISRIKSQLNFTEDIEKEIRHLREKRAATPSVVQYTIDVELNVLDLATVEKLKVVLANVNLLLSPSAEVNITNVQVTTVCLPNSAGFQCTCEDQYGWSCDKCTTYGQCNNITSETCGCINAIPPDGQFCQSILQQNFTSCTSTEAPTTQSTTSTNTITTRAMTSEISISKTSTTERTTAETVTTTSTTETTTATTETTTSTTETTTSTTETTTATTKTTTSPSTKLPTTTTTTPVPTVPPAKPAIKLNIEFSLDLVFTNSLNDITSSRYLEFKNGIEPKLQELFKLTTGFVSASILNFRSGSVIVAFEVKTTSVNKTELQGAQSGITSALGSSFPVIKGSFKTLYESLVAINYTPNPMYSGGTLTLTCGPPPAGVDAGELGDVVWKVNGNILTTLPRFRQYTDSNVKKLNVTNVIPSDSGLYECTLKGSLMDFHQQGNVTVNEAPLVQTDAQINTQCKIGRQSLMCCVQSPYQLQWQDANNNVLVSDSSPSSPNCIVHDYVMANCTTTQSITFTCQVKNLDYRAIARLTVFVEEVKCQSKEYGSGRIGDISQIDCGAGKEGFIQAVCDESKGWIPIKDTCVLIVIVNLQTAAQDLQLTGVPDFVNQLSDTTAQNQQQIVGSVTTMATMIDILNTVSLVSTNVSQPVIENFLKTVDILISDDAIQSWSTLNANSSSNNANTSSILLKSIESVSGALQGDSFSFPTKNMNLNRSTFDTSFSSDLNSSVLLNISEINSPTQVITTITFFSLQNVLPARNGINQSTNDNIINGNVVLIKLNGTSKNVSLGFKKLNASFTANPQCVFWNFDLFGGLGGWDNEGCKPQFNINGTVTCNCNHLTSFSILMSTSIPTFSPEQQAALDYITYIGVGISMGSLVVCLIIEACVWKTMTRNSTSYMRHVSIVNIAVSLLIADIWFIIGASISVDPDENGFVPLPACTAATFFIHFFYLALFFWMLISGLLLLYRTVMVFSHMEKSTMLAIGFSVGYGAPLIIAVVTVASTAPSDGYIRGGRICWLNWNETKALLAFVIPALTIVAINFIILVVVLYKMLRRGVGDTSQPDEKNTVVVIARCLAILTPFFGLTWALGVGVMIAEGDFGMNVAFAFFNSLQGFFILVFGTLLDAKIRAAICGLFTSASRSSHGTGTQSTSGGVSSSSAFNIFRRQQRRNMYNVSDAANARNSNASESFINI